MEPGGDRRQGKRFRLSSDFPGLPTEESPDVPGRVGRVQGGRALQFFVHVDRFENGAEPVIEITLFEETPQRVRFRTFSARGGRPMQRCTLTATMGNQSRCRHLWLRSRAVFAPDLYEGYRGDGFVEHDPYGVSKLHETRSGDVVVAISPNEREPREVFPLPSGAWHHPGRWAAQYWLKPKGSYDRTLRCRVNGRRVYWNSTEAIPGGIAFENFELREPYKEGRETWFGYTTGSPSRVFGFCYDVSAAASASGRSGPADAEGGPPGKSEPSLPAEPNARPR